MLKFKHYWQVEFDSKFTKKYSNLSPYKVSKSIGQIIQSQNYLKQREGLNLLLAATQYTLGLSQTQLGFSDHHIYGIVCILYPPITT